MWRAKTRRWPWPLRSVRSRWFSSGAAPEPTRRVAALSGLGLGAMDSRWPPAADILCQRPPAPAMLHLQKHLRISVLHPRLFSLNLFATTAASEASPDPAPFAIEDYLVATCGLTRDKAIKASKSISHLKSPSKPDAVLAFLSGLGLSSSVIASTVARNPKILCCNVEKVLAPRLAAVQEEHGLSTSQIARFFLADPSWIHQATIISKLQFYVPFFGSFNKLLLAVKKCRYLMCYNLDRVVKPNVSLLSEYALSALDISKICLKKPGLLYLPSWKVQAMAAWVDGVGIPRGKPMFRLALQCVAGHSEKSIAAKMELLKKALQCSDAEVMTLLSKSPALIETSLDRIQRVSQFLVSEAGLDPKYIASRPGLMTFSLEGRLRPRFYVMKFLKEKGLLGQQRSYYSPILVKEKDFVERFIHPYKDAAPHLAEDYAAACRGQVASRIKSQEPRTGLERV